MSEKNVKFVKVTFSTASVCVKMLLMFDEYVCNESACEVMFATEELVVLMLFCLIEKKT